MIDKRSALGNNSSESGKHNLFDPSQLRLSQNFSESIGVKKLVREIPVCKPHKQDFIRTHPDPSYHLETMVIELKEERETFLVIPDLWPELLTELTPKVLVTSINRQNVPFLWPIRLPDENGRHDPWNASSLDAASVAQKNWIRVAANMSRGAYDIYQAAIDLPDPDWPDLSFAKILETSFKDHYITDFDHSVLRRLRGEL